MLLIITISISLIIGFIFISKQKIKLSYFGIFYVICASFGMGVLIAIIISIFNPTKINRVITSYDLIPIDDSISISYIKVDSLLNKCNCVYYIEDNGVIKRGVVDYKDVVVKYVNTVPKVIITVVGVEDNIFNVFGDELLENTYYEFQLNKKTQSI